MLVHKTTIVGNLRYAGSNDRGVQLPTIRLVIPGEPQIRGVDPNFGVGDVDELVEVADSWFMWEKGGALVCGKEQGFLFLSPAGFQALKPLLKEAFDNLKQRPDPAFRPRVDTWEDLEAGVARFFEKIKAGTEKKRDLLQSKANELTQSLVETF